MRKAGALPPQPSPFEPPTSPADATAARPPDGAPPVPPVPQPPAPPADAELPDLIVLDVHFGFDRGGVLRVWSGGEPITNRADIAELLAAGAPHSAYRLIVKEQAP